MAQKPFSSGGGWLPYATPKGAAGYGTMASPAPLASPFGTTKSKSTGTESYSGSFQYKVNQY